MGRAASDNNRRVWRAIEQATAIELAVELHHGCTVLAKRGPRRQVQTWRCEEEGSDGAHVQWTRALGRLCSRTPPLPGRVVQRSSVKF